MNATYRSYSVTVPPTEYPVSLDEVRVHLRMGDLRDDDAYIVALIKAVTRHVEQYLGRALITQTIRDVHDKFPPTSEPITLRIAPAQSIVGISYRASDGTSTSVDSALYVQEFDSAPPRIGLAVDATWPTPQNRIGSVTITYEAGYGDTPDNVPDDIRTAIKLIIYDLYENRADTVKKYPTAAEMILSPYRVQQMA